MKSGGEGEGGDTQKEMMDELTGNKELYKSKKK